jgi:hypothetical protein
VIEVYTSIEDAPEQDPGTDEEDSGELAKTLRPKAFKAAKAVIVVPLPREIHKGAKGKDVVAVKRALKKWKATSVTNITATAGPGFVTAVKAFQKAKGLAVDGVYGKGTHAKLAPFFDSYGVYLLNHAHVETDRMRLQAAALSLLHYKETTGRMHYTQSQLRMSIVDHHYKPPWGQTIYEDCSSSLTGLSWVIGAPDPNGRGYDGEGYTGTIYNNGRSVDTPYPGDFLLCGSPPGHHVFMALGDDTRQPATRGWSHGSEGGPRLVALRYRSDIRDIRSYLPKD